MAYNAEATRPIGYLVTAANWNQMNDNIDFLAATSRHNLLTNGGFEVWARGGGPFTADLAYTADRWVMDEVGTTALSVAPDSTNQETGVYCAAVTVSSYNTESYLFQKLEHFHGLRGQEVTLAVRVKTTTAAAVRVQITDGVGTTTSATYHTGAGAYETLLVTRTISASATSVQVYVVFNANCTAYLDNATLTIGPIHADYVPSLLADVVDACQRYYYDGGGLSGALGDRGGMIAFFTDGTNTRVYGANAQFPTRMAGDPTVTGTNLTNNNFPATPGITNSSPTGAYEERTASATGYCNYITHITAEFNP